ncbi:hypothetical protein MPSEU_000781800 [Mayamaea pseudoterrestris]|nr:hypothetical protein MPSEU_000781800 [Mayamaea pseudoterrestris]
MMSSSPDQNPLTRWSSPLYIAEEGLQVNIPCGGCQNNNNQSPIKMHELPFHIDGKEITRVDVGKLMYLAKDSILTMRRRKINIESQSPQALDQTLTNDEPPPLYFRVVLQKNTDRYIYEQMPPTGTLAKTNKTLICAACCAKTFATLQAVLTHCHTQHPLPLDPMWTTPLKVVYQDTYIAIIVKPQGMAIMGDKHTLGKSDLLLPLANPKKRHFEENDDDDIHLTKPRVAHRLDAATGGLVVVCKTYQSERLVKEAFENRHVSKTYRAVVVGNVTADAGECSQLCSGKESLSKWKVLDRVRSVTYEWLTVLELQPVTGRMHQLRKHMKLMNHPILGDARYGGKDALVKRNLEPYSRLCLWAMKISFPHPKTKQVMTFEMDEPEWLTFVLEHERTQWNATDGRTNGDKINDE